MVDVIANGVRHHVQRLGHGEETVVFVHGLVMDNLSSFYFTLASPVAATSDVVLYDLRGHGMSERPAAGYAVADLVSDLAALLAALAIDRPVALVGNSFGGLVALAFAAKYPDRVTRLALIDAHDGTAGWAAQMSATLTLRGTARDAKIAESFADWLGRHSERKRNRLVRIAGALIGETSLVTDLGTSPALTAESLARIVCPTLALYGEFSDVRDRGEALAETLPACTFHSYPGCGHSVLWEATAAVRTRVVEFLR
ncbi:alpha/beta fold hydrolase [Skermania piniformis]|uniref:Alpha/beta hydrolase n=1 Tax=Skermania pinensis TaxID=39122 RepID=A0ABX8SFP8_9ACTN|nr:alpha/beta hydrolase [Skermania piniformis]QXQ15255.1 alpha/beta hydrolase [Skermania piniformis]